MNLLTTFLEAPPEAHAAAFVAFAVPAMLAFDWVLDSLFGSEGDWA